MFQVTIFLVLIALVCRSVLAISAMQRSANCTDGSFPCGPQGSACCPSGYDCNFDRGIPACENLANPLISGFLGRPCADPYLFDCSSLLGIAGYCCPIGTVCFNDGVDNVVSCINAYGTTAAAYPSATQGFVPSATSVANNDPAILFNPPSAWNSSSPAPSCSSSNSLHTTTVVNSTISFNYTGPSIMIRTVTSSQGGVFAVFVDGFNTTDVIDTYSGANLSLPLCYPNQYPPFLIPPPNLASQNDHSITLIYTGPSKNAPNGTMASIVQFDSFAIPEFQVSAPAMESSMGRKINGLILFTVAVSLTVTSCLCYSSL